MAWPVKWFRVMYGMSDNSLLFDYEGFGQAVKQAREARGWTQAYLAELVCRGDRTIINLENHGNESKDEESKAPNPSFDTFVRLVTMFNISVDQFFHREGQPDDDCSRHIDTLIHLLDKKERMVVEASVEATTKALIKARETPAE